MLCKNPYMGGPVPFGCGRCLPCCLNRRRQWTWRQYLESLCHDHSSFLTLTYAPEHLPAYQTLDPRHLQLFLKRLRKAVLPVRLRYFAVGEYTEQNQLPHFHISVFGLPPHAFDIYKTHPFDPRVVWLKSWPMGSAFLVPFNETTAQYVAGYVVKKLNKSDDPRLHPGQIPEFARMSRRPGLGKNAMALIAKGLSESGNIDRIPSGDVPAMLELGKRKIPLGRFLLKALREAVGFTPEYIDHLKQRGIYDQSLQLSALLKAALETEKSATTRSVYLESAHQKILQTEARARLFKKQEKL